MATVLFYPLIVSMLASFSSGFELPSLSAQGLSEMVNAEKHAEGYANVTLGKLLAFNSGLQAAVSNPSYSAAKASEIEQHATDKIAAIAKEAQDDSAAKLHQLLSVTAKETDLSLNNTAFAALRASRSGLLNGVGVDSAKLATLTQAYKNQLMKTELCAGQKLTSEQAQLLSKGAQTAAADLATFVGLAGKIASVAGASGHEEISKRSAQLQQLLQSKSDTSKQLIQALEHEIVSKIDGMAGVTCDDGAEEHHEDKRERRVKDEKAKHKPKKESAERHRSTAVELVDKSAFPLDSLTTSSQELDAVDVQGSNIENLQQLEEQAAGNAKQSLSQLKNWLEETNAKDMSDTGASEMATKIKKAVAAQFSQKRAALNAKVAADLDAISKLANASDSESYKAAVAASTRDLDAIKQLIVEEKAGKAEDAPLEHERDSATGHVGKILNQISAFSQAMITYADAVRQLQQQAGVSEAETNAHYTRAARLNTRLNQITDDSREASTVVLHTFFSAVRTHFDQVSTVQEDVATKEKAASSAETELAADDGKASSVFLAAAVAPRAQAPLSIIALVLGVFALLAALALATRMHPRASSINPAPLLG